MLIKKDNSNSAQLIPLTTAFAMFGSSKGFDGNATMSLQPMLTTEKIFFPGTNALVIGEHQTYDEDTQGFIGINQARSGYSQGGDGGGNGWGPTIDLKNVLTGDTWFKEFNRLENWCEFSEFPNNESANYLSTATAHRVVVKESTIPNVETDFYNESIYDDCRFTDNSWAIGNAWGSANNNNISIVVDPSTWRWASQSPAGVTGLVYATAYNEKFAGDANLYSLTGYVYTSEDFRYHTTRTHSTRYELDKKFTIPVFYDDKRILHFDTSEQVFTSGFTAKISNIDLSDVPLTLTGDDLFFVFNNTGTNVTGILQKLYIGDASAIVTADVEYKKVEDSVSSYNVSDYHWTNVECYVGDVGGGGGYSYNISFYPIGVANKYLMNPTAQSTVTPIVSGQGYTMISKNNIPDYYGGALLFSGNNLSQYYNTNVDKYFVIGLKGVSQYRTVGVDPKHYECNWECKAYKFDDTHFKKINDTTYAFFDDKLGKIYTCWDNNNNSGKLERTYVPIGPFFMEFDGYTYIYDTYGKRHKTFEINEENSYDIPTVLDSINYINSFDPEVETNSRYIITKPANSIYYGSNGFDKNHGSTEKYSYLALQLPTNILTGTPVYFNSNITEITQLGESVKNITAMYVNDGEPLTALTAIKANFGWCTNITQLPNLFAGATALKEVPDSFNNMGRLTGAPSMFMNCISLTELPDFYGLSRFEYGPAMFKNCNKVTTFPRGTLSELTAANEMFAGCTSLTGNYYDKMIPPTKWESFAPKLQGATFMFSGCSKITDIQTDLSATDITNMSGMFAGCTALTSDIAPILQFIVGKWDPGATGYFASAFMGCTGVTSGTNTYNDIINDPTPVPGFPSQTMGDSYWKPLFGVR